MPGSGQSTRLGLEMRNLPLALWAWNLPHHRFACHRYNLLHAELGCGGGLGVFDVRRRSVILFRLLA